MPTIRLRWWKAAEFALSWFGRGALALLVAAAVLLFVLAGRFAVLGVLPAGAGVVVLVRTLTARISVGRDDVVFTGTFRTRRLSPGPGDRFQLSGVASVYPSRRGVVMTTGSRYVELQPSAFLTAPQQAELSDALAALAARTGASCVVPTTWSVSVLDDADVRLPKRVRQAGRRRGR